MLDKLKLNSTKTIHHPIPAPPQFDNEKRTPLNHPTDRAELVTSTVTSTQSRNNTALHVALDSIFYKIKYSTSPFGSERPASSSSSSSSSARNLFSRVASFCCSSLRVCEYEKRARERSTAHEVFGFGCSTRSTNTYTQTARIVGHVWTLLLAG